MRRLSSQDPSYSGRAASQMSWLITSTPCDIALDRNDLCLGGSQCLVQIRNQIRFRLEPHR